MKKIRWAALLISIVLLFRGLVALGADTAFDALLHAVLQSDSLVQATVLSQSPILSHTAATATSTTTLTEIKSESEGIGMTDNLTSFTPQADPTYGWLPLSEPADDIIVSAATDEIENDTQSNVTQPQSPFDPTGIRLHNRTAQDIDIAALLAEPLSFNPANGGQPTVLLLHTHGTEAFTPTPAHWYENTEHYRSKDKSLNIIRVGDEIAAIFEARGIRVIHDRALHDYPSFRGSYGRSLAATERILAEHPEIQIVFDIHRDAIRDAAGNYLPTRAYVGGEQSGQVMLIVGTDQTGLYHPSWRENLKFALQLQSSMMTRYPTLARPIVLREERFNAHVRPGAVLVEIGSNANTLEEALITARFFANAAADTILGME